MPPALARLRPSSHRRSRRAAFAIVSCLASRRQAPPAFSRCARHRGASTRRPAGVVAPRVLAAPLRWRLGAHYNAPTPPPNRIGERQQAVIRLVLVLPPNRAPMNALLSSLATLLRDPVPYHGALGLIAIITLERLNAVVGLLVGLATLLYLCLRIRDQLRNRNPQSPSED